MNEEVLHVMRVEIENSVNKVVPPAIEKYVNGGVRKIQGMLEEQGVKQDVFNLKFETHLQKVEPYLQTYEGALGVGKFVIFWGAVISAMGGALLLIRALL